MSMPIDDHLDRLPNRIHVLPFAEVDPVLMGAAAAFLAEVSKKSDPAFALGVGIFAPDGTCLSVWTKRQEVSSLDIVNSQRRPKAVPGKVTSLALAEQIAGTLRSAHRGNTVAPALLWLDGYAGPPNDEILYFLYELLPA